MAARASFEDFYAATVDRLLGHLFLVTGDLHAAEEIVQEAFTRASMRWSRLRDYDVPEAWVRRVAMNLAADRARSLRRQTRAIIKLGPPPAVPAVSVETLALVQALGSLPVRQRQAIVLHYLAERAVRLPVLFRKGPPMEVTPVEAGDEFPVNFWAGLFLETGSPPPGGQMPELAVDRILAFDQAGKQVAACRARLGPGNTCQL